MYIDDIAEIISHQHPLTHDEAHTILRSLLAQSERAGEPITVTDDEEVTAADAAFLIEAAARTLETTPPGPIEDELRAATQRVLAARDTVTDAERYRDQLIIKARRAGMTQQAIADAAGMTRARVPQILARAGL